MRKFVSVSFKRHFSELILGNYLNFKGGAWVVQSHLTTTEELNALAHPNRMACCYVADDGCWAARDHLFASRKGSDGVGGPPSEFFHGFWPNGRLRPLRA